MAKLSNVGTRIWLDEFDISGFLNSAEQQVSQELPVVTAFGDSGPRRVVGNYDHTHNHGGFFDGAEGSFDKQIFDQLDVDEEHYLCDLFGSHAAGAVAYEKIVRLSEQPRVAQSGQAILLNLTSEGADAISRGIVLAAKQEISGNVEIAGQNQGETVQGQVYQTVIRVFSGTFTGFTVKLQQSQNDGTPDAYTDIPGLSQAITVPGVWRLTTTGATDVWKRVVVSDWVGTNAVISVTGGVVAGT